MAFADDVARRQALAVELGIEVQHPRAVGIDETCAAAARLKQMPAHRDQIFQRTGAVQRREVGKAAGPRLDGRPGSQQGRMAVRHGNVGLAQQGSVVKRQVGAHIPGQREAAALEAVGLPGGGQVVGPFGGAEVLLGVGQGTELGQLGRKLRIQVDHVGAGARGNRAEQLALGLRPGQVHPLDRDAGVVGLEARDQAQHIVVQMRRQLHRPELQPRLSCARLRPRCRRADSSGAQACLQQSAAGKGRELKRVHGAVNFTKVV